MKATPSTKGTTMGKSKHPATPPPPEKRPRGRPVKYPLPEPIPDTPENIAKAILGTPPKKRGNWRYAQERKES